MIDKELYQAAFRAYRQWNEEKELLQAEIGRELSPSRAWEAYAGLVEFCWKLNPQPSDYDRREKIDSLVRYYDRVQRMEAWRQARGKAA